MNVTGSLNQSFMFLTKEYDPETGLSYYGYRFYSPSLGRWITRDPIEEEGGMNLYQFAGNDPVMFADSYGLSPQGYGQFGGQLSGHYGPFGVSVSTGAAGSTGDEECVYVTMCLRIGPGIYAGAGGSFGAGIVGGNTSGLQGLSIGLGGDIGWGPSIGGQVSSSVGTGGINSIGLSKGTAGGGGGISLGIDICWTEMKCTCIK